MLFRSGVSVTSLCNSVDCSACVAVFSSPFNFPRNFLTARLRGDFGSIAMAPNPLTHIPYEICNLVAYFEIRCKQILCEPAAGAIRIAGRAKLLG